MRITNKMMANSVLANLQRSTERLAAAQDRLSSGKRLRKPSDDPPALTRALGLRRTIAENDQYLRNIDAAASWLGSADTVLAGAADVVMKAQTIGLRGANGTQGTEQMKAMALQVDSLLQELVQAGNTKYGDDYLFAGQAQSQAPYTPIEDPLTGQVTGVTYTGQGALDRTIGAGVKLAVNVGEGADVFQFQDVPARSTLDILISLRDALDGGDASGIEACLNDLDASIDHLTSMRAEVGTRAGRLADLEEQVEASQVGLQARLSQDEDVDMAEATATYAIDEVTHKAALATSARMMVPSLIDYLS